MSDVEYDATESEDFDSSEPDAIRNLRAANKRNEEKARAGEAAMRKLAFLEAGLDPRVNPQVELFMKAYDGELTDEAIRAEANRYKLLDTTPVQEVAPVKESSPFDTSQTASRSALGAETGDPGEPLEEGDPMLNAYTSFHSLRRDGMTSEEASVAVLGKIFEQARAGNEKFVFNAEDWQGSDSARSR